ncbi:MAG: hypothetical protein AB2A00_28245 [Myxococcota bacterium]
MEFVSPDPNATVRAANVKATLEAFKLVPSMGMKLVEKHQLNIQDLTPDNFIPVQRWLDALKELQASVGPSFVRKVGTNIVENAEFPPIFDSLEAFYEAMDKVYYMNHRGDVGHYITTRKPDGSIEVRCETPYPRQFEYGLIEGISRNPRLTKGKRYSVTYIDGPATGDHTCTLVVRPL